MQGKRRKLNTTSPASSRTPSWKTITEFDFEESSEDDDFSQFELSPSESDSDIEEIEEDNESISSKITSSIISNQQYGLPPLPAAFESQRCRC